MDDARAQLYDGKFGRAIEEISDEQRLITALVRPHDEHLPAAKLCSIVGVKDVCTFRPR